MVNQRPSIEFQAPNSKYQIPSTKFQAPNSKWEGRSGKYEVQFKLKFQVPSTKFQIPNTKFHPLPTTHYRLPTTDYRLLTKYQAPNSNTSTALGMYKNLNLPAVWLTSQISRLPSHVSRLKPACRMAGLTSFFYNPLFINLKTLPSRPQK